MKQDESFINFYEEEEELVSLEPIITFPLADQLYALPIGSVKEVIKSPEITIMPQLPQHLKGLVNVRGNVFAVLDLAQVFGYTSSLQEYTYLIILDLDNYAVALGVTAVPNTIHVNMDQIQKVQKSTGEKDMMDNYILGFIKHQDELIGLLAIDHLIASEEFARLIS